MDIEKLIKENKGTIVDVRSYAEYLGGHVAGSTLVPLQEIPYKMDLLKEMPAPIIFCCASGNRSAQATYFATQRGLNCVDGGSWLDVNYYKSLTEEETV